MGWFALGLGLAGCLMVLLPWQRWWKSETTSPLPTVGVVLAWVPFFVLVSRFVGNDLSIAVVNASGGGDMPLLYRVAATWSARTGPLLLWAGFTATLAWWWRRPMERESQSMAERRVGLLGGFAALLMLLAIHLKPFAPTLPGALPGELSPLLQTDLMVVHPPLVFLAYAFCLSIAATAVSSVGQDDAGLLDRMVRQARPGFFVTTLAIGLGGLWAYLILDWGGYWAWDPVETASFLPWLALAVLAHLRTVPRKVPPTVLRAVGLTTGALALFATLVTRAGGAWASSVHTFVVDAEGSAPPDAFGRIVALAIDAGPGIEVMSYLLVLLALVGWWFADVTIASGARRLRQTPMVDLAIPMLVLLAVLLEAFTAEPLALLGLQGLPWLWAVVVFLPTAMGTRRIHREADEVERPFGRPFGLPLDVLLAVLIAALGGDVFLAILWLALFAPLAHSTSPTEAWPAAVAGVGLALAAAWTDLTEVGVAVLMLLPFLLPWLLEGDVEDEAEKASPLARSMLRASLWAGAGLSGLVLVLTLVILLGSIDQIHFAAHEVYTSVFIASAAGAFVLYGTRDEPPKRRGGLLGGVAVFSALGLWLAPGWWGGDAMEALSSLVLRGHVAWIVLPVLLLAVPIIVRELGRKVRASSSTPVWRRIPVQAHLIHLGLLLLLVGHVFTTTLVDRGDPIHRITMLQDEAVTVDGLSYTFTELTLVPEEDLKVGDGGIFATIEVHDGERNLGTVEPGMVRFDASGFPRSEVDVLRRWSGDVVFIFDYSQADTLMPQTLAEDGEGVDAVRITVYRLPQSHLVWLGWCLMLLGMAALGLRNVSLTRPSSAAA